jgi:hypothetical protein
VKKLTKRPAPESTPRKLDDAPLQHVRGGGGGAGKVVMDSNVLPT